MKIRLRDISVLLLGIVYLSGFGFLALSSTLTPNNDRNHAVRSDHQTGTLVTADDRIANYTEWLAGFTAALVLVTAGQIGFLIRADRTARISAEGARRAAVATELSVAKMGETAERQLRAYVTVWLVTHPTIVPGFEPKATIAIKNMGQTPAYDLTMWAMFGILPKLRPDSFPIIPKDRIPNIVLDPGSSHHYGVSRTPLTREEYSSIASKDECKLYLWGQMVFTDAFKQKRTRDLWYEMDNSNEGNMLICDTGNIST